MFGCLVVAWVVRKGMEGQRVGGPREGGREGCLEAWLLLRDIAIARRSHAANSKPLRNYETSQQTYQPTICVTITGRAYAGQVRQNVIESI